MKMNKKAQVIATSVAAIALSSSLIAGSTFALFTSESNVNIAVTSGKVQIKAWLDENVKSGSALGGEALGTYSTEGGKISLNSIAPGDEFTFTLKTENTSTISTLYRTIIEVEESELASELTITVGTAEYSALKSYASGWAQLAVNATPADLEIKVAFPAKDEDQNELKGKNTSISITLEGVQGNAGYKIGGEPEVDCYVDDVVSALYYEFEGNTCVIKGVDENAEEVTVPAQVNGNPVKIAPNAFQNLTNLKKVTLACAEIPEYAFSGCTSLEEIVLEEGVETLGYHAFACGEKYVGGGNYELTETNNLKTVHIADSVKKLSDTFYYCENLTEVTFGENSQLVEIGSSTFEGCKNLANITIPEGVEKIGDNAFIGCAITEIVIPASVKAIDSRAFQGCANLEKITLPATLEAYGDSNQIDIFSGCTSLSEIVISGTQEECDAFWSKLNYTANKNRTSLYGILVYSVYGDIEVTEVTVKFNDEVKATWNVDDLGEVELGASEGFKDPYQYGYKDNIGGDFGPGFTG